MEIHIGIHPRLLFLFPSWVVTSFPDESPCWGWGLSYSADWNILFVRPVHNTIGKTSNSTDRQRTRDLMRTTGWRLNRVYLSSGAGLLFLFRFTSYAVSSRKNLLTVTLYICSFSASSLSLFLWAHHPFERFLINLIRSRRLGNWRIISYLFAK